MDPVKFVYESLVNCSWFGGAAHGVDHGRPAVIVYTKSRLSSPPVLECELPVIFRECGVVRKMVATRAVG